MCEADGKLKPFSIEVTSFLNSYKIRKYVLTKGDPKSLATATVTFALLSRAETVQAFCLC